MMYMNFLIEMMSTMKIFKFYKNVVNLEIKYGVFFIISLQMFCGKIHLFDKTINNYKLKKTQFHYHD